MIIYGNFDLKSVAIFILEALEFRN